MKTSGLLGASRPQGKPFLLVFFLSPKKGYGLPHSYFMCLNCRFVDLYGKFTTASENNLPVDDVDNELPSAFKLVSQHALSGVAPVFGSEHKLAQAVREHANNFDMLQAARDPSIKGKDSSFLELDGKNYSVASLGIGQETFDGLRKHGVAVYSVAGYYDSASVRSSARLHNYLVREGSLGQSKLTIGPWTHGARSCWTPTAAGTTSQYPLFQDVKRFFDCKLKDDCASFSGEKDLNYFVSGEDVWAHSEGIWPPPALAQLKSFPLNSFPMVDGHESLRPLKFQVKFNATSGSVSRWNLVFHLMKMSVTYPHLHTQQDTSLTFSSQPLDAAMKLLGSVHVSLSLALNEEAYDAAIFAYLEEVDAYTKSINYITEGVIRVSHAVVSSDHSHVGAFDSIKRSFAVEDMVKLTPGQHTVVEFVMEPIAYTVPKNHVLRLRLAGADADNFFLDNIEGLATIWDIDTASSAIHIPVVPS